MDNPTVEAEDQALAQQKANILGNAIGVRGLVKGQKNSHSGLLGKVRETMHSQCILMTILHTRRPRVQRGAYLVLHACPTPFVYPAHFNAAGYVLLGPTFSFTAVLDLAADAPAFYLLPRLRGEEARGPLLGTSAFFCFVCRVIEMETGDVVWVGGPPIFLFSRIDDGIS